MDKQKYTKPLFIIEQYAYNDSIAACEYQTDPNKPLEIVEGQMLCNVGDEGHVAGRGSIKKTAFPTTVFNDGIDHDACIYDWDGIIVAQTGESFGKSFYGANANNDNHVPAYNGGIMFS